MEVRDFPFQLRSAVWEITLACCFRCAYCGSRGGQARENELTTAEETLSDAEHEANEAARNLAEADEVAETQAQALENAARNCGGCSGC